MVKIVKNTHSKCVKVHDYLKIKIDNVGLQPIQFWLLNGKRWVYKAVLDAKRLSYGG